jgi:hypothetical protein
VKKKLKSKIRGTVPLNVLEVKTLSSSVKYGWMSNFSDFQIVSPLIFSILVFGNKVSRKVVG